MLVNGADLAESKKVWERWKATRRPSTADGRQSRKKLAREAAGCAVDGLDNANRHFRKSSLRC